MTSRLRYGMHVLPNQRAIQSRLERVSNDMGLEKFYLRIAVALSNKTVTAESFLEIWYAELAKLSGNGHKFVAINFIPYAKQLFWDKNPYFCQIVMAKYEEPGEGEVPAVEQTSQVVYEEEKQPAKIEDQPLPEAEVEPAEPAEPEIEVETEEETHDSIPVAVAVETEVEPVKLKSTHETQELPDFKKMNLVALRDYAHDHSVDIEGKRSKDDIRDAIYEVLGIK